MLKKKKKIDSAFVSWLNIQLLGIPQRYILRSLLLNIFFSEFLPITLNDTHREKLFYSIH